MTNEEKATQIARKHCISYGFGLNQDDSVECYESAMEMADYIIDQTCIWLANYLEYTTDSKEAKKKVVDEFRQAMKE